MSMPEPPDVSFVSTAIGSDEAALRAKLGNDGYELWKSHDQRLAEAKVADTEARCEQTIASTRYVMAKGTFWKSMAFTSSLAALTGLGWSIWAWIS
jgi:hypothetical protein